MSNNHFKYFRVKNFKRFKDLEVKDIGQFNLVLGDNNVGKTSLLEALLFQPSFKIFEASLYKVLRLKNMGQVNARDIFKFYLNSDQRIAGNNEINFDFSLLGEKLSVKYNFVFDAKSEPFVEIFPSFQIKPGNERIDLGFLQNMKSVPFIPFSYGYANDLVENYSSYIQGDRDLKKRILRELKRLHPSLEDIEINISMFENQSTLICYFEDRNGTVPLGLLGDGVIKLFRIFIELVNNRGNLIMIDEIDTGIHYTRMKEYWKVILQSAKENDVQLFASTHNKECMESFQLALEELGKEYTSSARAITLKESPKTRDIKAYTNTYEVFEDALEIGNDLR